MSYIPMDYFGIFDFHLLFTFGYFDSYNHYYLLIQIIQIFWNGFYELLILNYYFQKNKKYLRNTEKEKKNSIRRVRNFVEIITSQQNMQISSRLHYEGTFSWISCVKKEFFKQRKNNIFTFFLKLVLLYLLQIL